MLCRSLSDPSVLMTVPVAGSNRTGILNLYVKGMPTVAVVWPAGFCLSIFSTGIRRLRQLCLRLLVEPLVNQRKFPWEFKLHDMLPVNTTSLKMTSQDVGLLPTKLMFEVSGLDAEKCWNVQLPS